MKFIIFINLYDNNNKKWVKLKLFTKLMTFLKN